MSYYDLDDRPTDMMTWARLFEARGPNGTWRVGEDKVAGYEVSTVWLGINHRFDDGPPLIYETMVFGDGPTDGYTKRYSTRAEAEAGHARVIAALRDGRDPE